MEEKINKVLVEMVIGLESTGCSNWDIASFLISYLRANVDDIITTYEAV